MVVSKTLLLLPYRREALYTWKQRNGPKATYSELMEIFERAGHKGYADEVRRIAELSDSEADHSSGNREEQPKTYPTQHKVHPFSHDPFPPAKPEVYVMVKEKNLPGKTLPHANTETCMQLHCESIDKI